MRILKIAQALKSLKIGRAAHAHGAMSEGAAFDLRGDLLLTPAPLLVPGVGVGRTHSTGYYRRRR